jgi:GT2 family glycosyltransferase
VRKLLHGGLSVTGKARGACPRDVSIIIPVRDRKRELAACLEAVQEQLSARRTWEVVVVDDGSIEHVPRPSADQSEVRVLRRPALGPGAARNAGADVAHGRVLVFLDADCVPEAGCLDALLAPFTDSNVSGVRGAYTTNQRGSIARFVQLEMDEKQRELARARQTSVVDTACAAYRRPVFLTSGGFDESLPPSSAEDVELSFRLSAQGHRLVYAPAARVRHQHPEQLGTYLWRKARFAYFRTQLYRRDPSRLQGDGYTPPVLRVQLATSTLMVLSGLAGLRARLARRSAVLAALILLLSGLPMARRAWAIEPKLAALVLPLLLARSLAQLAGIATALLARPLRPHPPEPSRRTGARDPAVDSPADDCPST